MDVTPAPASKPTLLGALARPCELLPLLVIAAMIGGAYGLRRGGLVSRPVEWSEWTCSLAVLGVLAVGEAVVLVAGGIDLSLGAVAAASTFVLARLATSWTPRGAAAPPLGMVALAVGLALSIGLVVGLWNGLLVNLWRAPPYLATLATAALMTGLVANLGPAGAPFDVFRAAGLRRDLAGAVFAVFALVASVLMGMTVIGRQLHAVGGNEAAARLSGLPVRRIRTFSYLLSGLSAALSGVMFTGRSGLGLPESVGHVALLAIAAAVLGGCRLTGGFGSIRGAVLGAALIVLVEDAVRSLVPDGTTSTRVDGLVAGGAMVVALAFSMHSRRRG
jgi:ribose/xylose/arabinose/galactoside ABC-type transport system permease subunit